MDLMIHLGVEDCFEELVLLFFLMGEWLGEEGSGPLSFSEIDKFVMCLLRLGLIGSGAVRIGRASGSSLRRVMSTISSSRTAVVESKALVKRASAIGLSEAVTCPLLEEQPRVGTGGEDFVTSLPLVGDGDDVSPSVAARRDLLPDVSA